jgi:hypothetical protein
MAPVEVLDFLERLGPMRAVYEAGTTGFGLAPAARERGMQSPPALVEVAGHEPGGDRVPECSIPREAAIHAA